MRDSAVLNRADNQAVVQNVCSGILLDFSSEMTEQLNYVWILFRGFSGLMFDFSLQGCILLLWKITFITKMAAGIIDCSLVAHSHCNDHNYLLALIFPHKCSIPRTVLYLKHLYKNYSSALGVSGTRRQLVPEILLWLLKTGRALQSAVHNQTTSLPSVLRQPAHGEREHHGHKPLPDRRAAEDNEGGSGVKCEGINPDCVML